MSGFQLSAPGEIRATFTSEEATLLSGLALQIASLVDNREGPGTDPAIDRLLPDGYRDDDESAIEFRRFTEEELANGKVQNALLVAEALATPEADDSEADGTGADGTEPDGTVESEPVEVELDAPLAGSWLRTLTDIRLALAVRLDIGDDGFPRVLGEEQELLFSIYDWLGYLQDSLVTAVDT